MPNPIPLDRVVDTALIYVLKRQVQGRPTTVRQLSKRIGLGVSTIKGKLEEEEVDYVLIMQDEDSWSSSDLEIAIRAVPEKIAMRNNLTTEEIHDSYLAIFGNDDPVEKEAMTEVDREEAINNSDPYYPYRITTAEYRKMKDKLIGYFDLVAYAKKHGYAGSAVWRAVGGDRLILEFATPMWRPYIYQGSRYYSKEVLKHLPDLLLTYKKDRTGKVKEQKRRRRVAGAKLIESSWR